MTWGCSVGTHSHVDVASGADLGTDMATNAAVIVRVDVAAHGGIGLGGALDGILRAVDHAIVTFEAHAAAHAAFCLGAHIVFIQAAEAFLEMTQYLVGADPGFLALVTRGVGEVPEIQHVMRNDFLA